MHTTNHNTGQNLWTKSKTIIPGGNQLLSKRAERFLPKLWPSYASKASGCEVWDLDGNRYYDFAQMGVGSCSLGYADADVNLAVKQAIDLGSMSTLNAPEEVELAESLVQIHPWAEMVRFARTGGEACAIAIRIARAASGKSKVAFCGYHGWHDWYISSNLSNPDNLNQQLLPGLDPAGIPEQMAGTSIPFFYNDLASLEKVVADNGNSIGAIIMEPQRNHNPAPGFLEGVRKIADRINAVLIFDEVTSGFRMNFGGIHMLHDVAPDIAVFGKSLGNGFAISAIIGKRAVMDAAQNTFISSTMWTEKVGFVAALATLAKFKRLNVHEHLIEMGEAIQSGWKKIASNNQLSIEVSGIPPLAHIHFNLKQSNAAQTLYAQEMLKKGYLVGSSVYTALPYTHRIIDQFIEHSNDTFALIKKADDSGDITTYLETDVIASGFKRLT